MQKKKNKLNQKKREKTYKMHTQNNISHPLWGLLCYEQQQQPRVRRRKKTFLVHFLVL